MKGKYFGGTEKSECPLPGGKKKNIEKLHVARIDLNSGVFQYVDFLPPGALQADLKFCTFKSWVK